MRMMFLAATVFVTACAAPSPHELTVNYPAGPEPTKEQLEPAVKDWIANSLKDPDSPKQFRIINIMKTRWVVPPPITYSNASAAEGWLACFEYNAKNSYGAYAGTTIEGLVFRLTSRGQPEIVAREGVVALAPRCK